MNILSIDNKFKTESMMLSISSANDKNYTDNESDCNEYMTWIRKHIWRLGFSCETSWKTCNGSWIWSCEESVILKKTGIVWLCVIYLSVKVRLHTMQKKDWHNKEI